jgi:hypothetical protein
LLRQERYAKEGDRDAAAPAGFPFVQVKKWENVETRFAQTRRFLIHFLPRTNGSA